MNIAHPSEFRQLREAREALFKPAPADERFDADHPVTMRCSACGKFGYGPRSQIQEAVREHNRHCPARKNAPESDDRSMTRIFYPRA